MCQRRARLQHWRKHCDSNHPQIDTAAGRWISDEPQIIDSHDRPDEAEAGPHILQLSLTDFQELEDAIRHFEGMASCLP